MSGLQPKTAYHGFNVGIFYHFPSQQQGGGYGRGGQYNGYGVAGIYRGGWKLVRNIRLISGGRISHLSLPLQDPLPIIGE